MPNPCEWRGVIYPSQKAAAKAAGVIESTVYDHLKRRGSLNRLGIEHGAFMSIRDLAKEMRPADAVAMLLDVLETTAPEHHPDNLDRLREAGFRPTQARIFALLMAARGRCLSRDHICDRCCREGTHSSAVNAQIAYLRKTIATKGWPVEITAVWGDGYAMTVPEGWTPPKEVEDE